jgi:iron complex transport system ATP-binding protein
MKNILELKNVGVGFKNVLFKNINAELAQGSLVALMGINGVGKSSLLKTIASLLEIKEGDIFFEGKLSKNISPSDFAKLVGIVLTEKLQIDYLSVEELVSFGRTPYTNRTGKLKTEDHSAINKALEQTGITTLRAALFSELSDGQKQKVLIARALAQEPKLLILDEPTTYLDIPSKLELINLLKKLSRENNLAVLMSTHDLDLIEKSADKIWLMEKNGNFSIGSPEELKSTGLIAKNFYI